MDTNDVIIRELSDAEISTRRPFAHFGWEGDDSFSFSTISDGYWESAKIILEHMKQNSNDFAIVDTLVYPLFFNYRHSVETSLKSLFFNFGKHSEDARREYLEIGHNLQHLWATLKPFLQKRKKHIGGSVDLNAVEHYINEINGFDPDSMVMRYPVEKDLSANKKKAHHFDFIHFSIRMNELCSSLRQINYELSNEMDEEASLEELTDYLNVLELYREEIGRFIEILKRSIENKDNCNDDKGKSVIDRILNKKPSPVLDFLMSCDSDLLILLDNLFYGGRSVNEHVVRLSNSLVQRQKEFVRFCNELLEQDHLCFGQDPEEGQVNILGKTAEALLKHISTSLNILDLQLLEIPK